MEKEKEVTLEGLRELVSNLEDGVILVVQLEERGGIGDGGSKRS
ncbi:hypothetical protein M2145_002717 [Lachnospiraceae bacterium PF1-21]